MIYSFKNRLQLYRNVPNLKILVGGGDGSLGWVLSAFDSLKFSDPLPPIAILPLGNGNNLARALNWGTSYKYESAYDILSKLDHSRPILLDRLISFYI
jgi:diacylglycerol kinase (ATP)